MMGSTVQMLFGSVSLVTLPIIHPLCLTPTSVTQEAGSMPCQILNTRQQNLYHLLHAPPALWSGPASVNLSQLHDTFRCS